MPAFTVFGLLGLLFASLGLQPSALAEPARLGPARFDVPYVADAHAKQTLDIHLPGPAGGARPPVPCVIYVHGGAWAIGDKSRVQGKDAFYNTKCWAFISVNYRLSPEVTHPAHAEDVAAAVAWVFEHADRLGIDRQCVALMGHSAGAHLVSLVATDERLLAAHDLKPTILSGVVSLDTASHDIEDAATRPRMGEMIERAFGADTAAQRDASPVRHVEPGGLVPPVLLVYAGERRDARGANESMHEALRAAGARSILLPAPGKDHAAVNRDVAVPTDPMGRAIDAFLRGVFELEP
ncbi:MAG: alpha/beta hydrolase [Planctomycetota bacterium]